MAGAKPPAEPGSAMALFSRRMPLAPLIEMCRVLRHYLRSGLTLRDVFRQQAQRGPRAVRPVAGRIAAHLEQGDDLSHALAHEPGVFPELLVAMAGVGEHTGMLAEVFGELERYYQRVYQLRKAFLTRIAWPVIQFTLAVFVIAGMLTILGVLAESRPGSAPFDPIGWGVGPRAAVRFLAVVAGTLAGLAGLYLVLTRVLRKQGPVDRFLLHVPAVGPALRALALMRFCLALRLTTETGMSIMEALRLSLRATSNGAFIGQTEAVVAAVRRGEDLTKALTRAGVFPSLFINVIAVGEETGDLPEVLQKQGDYYDEEAGRRLAILTAVAGWGVWLVVAVLIIWCIFRIFTTYLSILERF
jgi:type II secretory pathway component PulF